MTVVIFSLGYLLIDVEENYVWLVEMILIIQGLFLLNLLFLHFRVHKILCVLVTLVFLYSFLQNPAKRFLKSANHYEYFYNIAESCKNEYNIQGTIYQRGDFGSTQYICFLLNCPQIIKNPDYPAEGEFSWQTLPPEKNLLENNVMYFFDWHWNNPPADSIYDFEEITNNKIYGLKIYKVK